MEDQRAPARALVTEEIVLKVVRNDFGPGAKLTSWEVRDFTKPGDNYCSYVTSVFTKFELDGELREKSYIAKINPLREPSPVTEMLEAMFGREATIIHDICSSMSAELLKIKLPPLNVPKIFAWTLEDRKQVLMMGDLRSKGFKMHDRKIGLDVQHVLLVVKELGRYNASSILLQESLPNKSLYDTYSNLEEPWFDPTSKIHDVFSHMIKSQCENVIKFLDPLPKYSKCVDWFKKNADLHTEFFIELFKEGGKFTVFSHGDCWVNNILFKYDECNNPVDVMLVDLQCSRKSSAVGDLSYFLYSSLGANTRKVYFHKIMVTYYLSFLEVCLMANFPPPFTFDELQEEMRSKKLFGLYAATMLLPIILTEEEDVVDVLSLNEGNMEEYLATMKEKFELLANKEGSIFKDRFLPVFDEMLESGIFDK